VKIYGRTTAGIYLGLFILALIAIILVLDNPTGTTSMGCKRNCYHNIEFQITEQAVRLGTNGPIVLQGKVLKGSPLLEAGTIYAFKSWTEESYTLKVGQTATFQCNLNTRGMLIYRCDLIDQRVFTTP